MKRLRIRTYYLLLWPYEMRTELRGHPLAKGIVGNHFHSSLELLLSCKYTSSFDHSIYTFNGSDGFFPIFSSKYYLFFIQYVTLNE